MTEVRVGISHKIETNMFKEFYAAYEYATERIEHNFSVDLESKGFVFRVNPESLLIENIETNESFHFLKREDLVKFCYSFFSMSFGSYEYRRFAINMKTRRCSFDPRKVMSWMTNEFDLVLYKIGFEDQIFVSFPGDDHVSFSTPYEEEAKIESRSVATYAMIGMLQE